MNFEEAETTVYPFREKVRTCLPSRQAGLRIRD